jgi:hypothetical protein
LQIDVLANDADPDGDLVTIIAFTQPAGSSGTVTQHGDQLHYAPSRSEPATFTYTISDGQGHTATATVTITVVD